MEKNIDGIVAAMKEIVDANGPNYLTDEPYQLYKKLMDSGSIDAKTAGAVLCFLVDGVLRKVSPDADYALLSKSIQRTCGFNKSMADRLAGIFLSLYSHGNAEEWKRKGNEGVEQFLKEKFTCVWDGFAVWEVNSGSVDCHYSAKITLSPTEAAATDKELTEMLKANPFTQKETICEHFRNRLKEYLDCEFEEYCTEEDYYQPVVEDFEIETRLTDWCKKNGFSLILCEGNGYDEGFEPKFRKRGY